MKLQISNKLKFYHAIYVVVALLGAFSIYAAYSLTGNLIEPLLQFALAMLVIWGVSKIRYQRINTWSTLGLFVAIVLLFCTLIFGKGGGGRSIRIGSLQFQTFYFIACSIVLYLATFLAKKCEKKDPKDPYLSLHDTRYVFIIIAVCVAAIAARNLSTAILLFITSMAIVYVAGVRWKYLFVFAAICIFAGGLYLYIGDKKSEKATVENVMDEEEHSGRGSTAMNRVKYWLTGESETVGYGKQMTLAKAAIARSFTRPTGPGRGMMKRSMAEGDNDYIFALICEELTIISALAIVILYMILFYQSILIARKAIGNPQKGTKGYFIKLFSVGIGVMIIGQATIHIGANVGVIPPTGQTLPFISRGASTLFMTCVMVGMLVNMGKQVDEKTMDDDEDLAV